MAIGTIINALSLLNSAAPTLGKLASKFLDGQVTKEELDYEASKHALSAETLLALEQIKTNQQAASHPSIFVSGARPFVLWVSALAFAMITIVFPFLQFFFPDTGTPVLDSELVFMVLGGLLGIGGLRTAEKLNGKARNNLRN